VVAEQSNSQWLAYRGGNGGAATAAGCADPAASVSALPADGKQNEIPPHDSWQTWLSGPGSHFLTGKFGVLSPEAFAANFSGVPAETQAVRETVLEIPGAHGSDVHGTQHGKHSEGPLQHDNASVSAVPHDVHAPKDGSVSSSSHIAVGCEGHEVLQVVSHEAGAAEAEGSQAGGEGGEASGASSKTGGEGGRGGVEADASSPKRMKCAPEEPAPIFWLREFIDVQTITKILALPFQNKQISGGLFDRTHDIRQVLQSFLTRCVAGASCVDVSYKEDRLCAATQRRGRLFSSGSAFGLPKLLKQLIRGGSSQSNFRDYDLKSSFPRAMLARHEWAVFIGQWVRGEIKIEGFPRETIKTFINICPGVGDAGVKKWLQEQGLSSLPEVLEGYLSDVRKAAEVDYAANPDLVALLSSLSRYRGLSESGRRWSIKNAIQYILNSQWERAELEGAAARIREAGVANLQCIEMDGMWLQLAANRTWKEVETLLGSGFSFKPYDSIESLVMKLDLEQQPSQDTFEATVSFQKQPKHMALIDTWYHNASFSVHVDCHSLSGRGSRGFVAARSSKCL